MTKTLPRLRSPTLDDVKRTATAVAAHGHDAAPRNGAPAPAPSVPEVVEGSYIDRRRLAAAREIVRRYRRWTMAAAAAPLPLADAALVSGVQVRMLWRLARLYDVPFERVRVASLVSALFGGWTPYTITVGFVGAAARMAPGVGTVVGIATSIGTSTLATEAIGKIFVQHFEGGGTFLDFEPKKYRQQLDQSKRAGPEKDVPPASRDA